jgi:ADP-ribose pyrophosphatase YjhB (NUDIX family)
VDLGDLPAVSDAPTQTDVGWLSPETLELVRASVPLVYVDAVPVRVDELGQVTDVGMLLRVAADGSISRMVVSGRILFGERVRDALLRHLEKDLGPLALPRVPPDPSPFAVIEYFPDPERSGFYDPRHHAVSLAYVVPVDGDCQPTQKALDLAWFTPEEAVSERVRDEMTGGVDRLIRMALAHVGALPWSEGPPGSTGPGVACDFDAGG